MPSPLPKFLGSCESESVVAVIDDFTWFSFANDAKEPVNIIAIAMIRFFIFWILILLVCIVNFSFC